ncbi:membrane-associated transporter protein-like isoform X2 [Stegodyphus dumicola]|nr:membrane-associated transporter protein-like isoform X2 [Stegodyphus dumicola]
MHKTSAYVRTVVAVHNLRDRAKGAVEALQEKGLSERIEEGWGNTRRAVSTSTRNFFSHPETVHCSYIPPAYSYIFRPKSRWELVLLSGTVCGIEFCYAAETAFVTPILLSLGLSIKFVTMIWCLSPLIGFFLNPILGSLSDTCESRFGRRRPFIFLFSVGILLGLIFVPNGHHIGIALGDISNTQTEQNDAKVSVKVKEMNATTNSSLVKYMALELATEKIPLIDYNVTSARNGDRILIQNHKKFKRQIYVLESDHKHQDFLDLYLSPIKNKMETFSMEDIPNQRFRRHTFERYANVTNALKFANKSVSHLQPWSITFTVIGTVLLDFCSDACQSPSRTYLLDVSLPEDHAAGLSTFTLMAGLGGSIGYLMGAVHWESTFLGHMLGGQVNAVFAIVTVIFIICLIATVCSFPEIPLPLLKDPKVLKEYQEKLQIGKYQESGNEMIVLESKPVEYGSTGHFSSPEALPEKENANNLNLAEAFRDSPAANMNSEVPKPSTQDVVAIDEILSPGEEPTLKEYLKSIVIMPSSLKILCLTNLFCWMSLVCYSLYFTDFVGECVYGGDPQAPEGSESHRIYEDGVRFACWGMALYSLSCSAYSYFIEALVQKFGAKPVYIGGQLVYSIGMVVMAITRHPAAVILLSPTAGVMYSTLFTMPYLLIAHYHCTRKFKDDRTGSDCGVRGIGTDVATVSSMVFLSQFILSLSMGSIVEAVGSNVATVCAAAFLSACGAVSATQVMYLDI